MGTVGIKSVVELRKEFAKLRENAEYIVGVKTWMAAVERLLPADPTPEQWVTAAKKARVKCPTCKGTGVYQWGTSVNGVMSHSGPCFRCHGTGFQGQDDFKRNQYYDNHRRIY